MLTRLITQSVDKITVRELTEDCHCNRSTFYYYSDNIDKLADAALERALPYELPLALLSFLTAGNAPDNANRQLDAIVKERVSMRSEYIDMLCRLLNGPNASLVEREVKAAMMQMLPVIITRLFPDKKVDEVSARIVFESATGSILSMMAYRGASDLKIPVERIILTMAPELPQAFIACLKRATAEHGQPTTDRQSPLPEAD
ncbi:TetR family transcriptional regulator [Bifidobacterium anseris]|uniref:TetR family transcriptional regulator n=1 Tax=Bifidobacterium anseris TaxID=2020963 RepID=A0A2N5J2A2_9BIFI|nr:TetR family transcriptional regulator [Bifidobacterium anseris]